MGNLWNHGPSLPYPLVLCKQGQVEDLELNSPEANGNSPQPFPPQPSDVRASVASTKPSHVEATSPRSSCWSQQNGISQPGVFRWPRTGPGLSRAGSPRASWRSCHAFVPPNTQSIQIRNLEVSYTWKEATCQSYPWCGSAEWTHLSVSENGLVTHSVKP